MKLWTVLIYKNHRAWRWNCAHKTRNNLRILTHWSKITSKYFLEKTYRTHFKLHWLFLTACSFKKEESHIKDTTDFVRFIENTPLSDNAIFATLDVCPLYTKIPQEEGIKLVTNTTTNIICLTHHSPQPTLRTLWNWY